MDRKAGIAILAALFAGPATVAASDLVPTGSIEGSVHNAAGVTQMGAVVTLYNRYEKLLGRALTDFDGRFRFTNLLPDRYSVRVAQPNYVSASRLNIVVRAGLAGFLDVQLASLVSSIELVYAPPGQNGVLSEDWKWTLRASSATRPVLRLLPRERRTGGQAVFSQTHGMLRLSAGEMAGSTALGSEADLGTAFALATSVYGEHQVLLSGNVGYASALGTPAAGFRTSYRNTGPNAAYSPGVELTVRQATIRQRAGQGLLAGDGSPLPVPVLRSMSAKVGQHTRLTGAISLDYGAAMDSVQFLERLTYLSPFARLTVEAGELGTLQAGYSSGGPAFDLLEQRSVSGDELQRDLAGLALFPRLSLRNGQTRLSRADNFELGYRREHGTRVFAAAVYEERLRDATVNIAGDGGALLATSDLLPDLASRASVFNIGSLRARGFAATMTQLLGDRWSAGVAYGLGSALAAQPGAAAGSESEAGALRARFTTVSRQWASARVSGTTPYTRSKLSASYVWTPRGALAPAHSYLTNISVPQFGLNLQLRQPIGGFGSTSRVDVTADVRNILSQGYLPLSSLTGRTYTIIQYPRIVRGGLSLTF